MTSGKENAARTATCAACLFYRPPEGTGPGQCRRRSPRAIQTRADPREFRSVWPEVWGEIDFCGEFVSRDGEVRP